MMKTRAMKISITSFYVLSLFLQACSTAGPGLFNKKTPHEVYGEKLKEAGLSQSAMGSQWFQAAESSLANPLQVSLPYRETGYFGAERPAAMAVQFMARRGEKLMVKLEKNPASGFQLYLDLWQKQESATREPKLLTSTDTSGRELFYEIKKDGSYLVRLQPELLKSGEYTLTIINDASLAFPVSPKAKSNIGSFWGAGRDNGARKHEGIDIFAPFRTPVVAAADGKITRVEETAIGGKVVWLKPYDKDYTLYYAHLDSQTTSAGQDIKSGQQLGLLGKTGNARTTSPHLHFGVYTFEGAVDPLPFVNQQRKQPLNISVPEENIGRELRTRQRTSLYSSPDLKSPAMQIVEARTFLVSEGATADFYKVILPSAVIGFIPGKAVAGLDPVKKLTAKMPVPLYDSPDTLAPKKLLLEAGNQLNILAGYNEFYYISHEDQKGWVQKERID